jgi:hypothetical protein
MLICLLSFRAKNTDTVWPSRDELSERSGYSPSVCSRVTTQLVELGWLEKHQRGRKRSAVYKVTVPDLDTVSDGKSVTNAVTDEMTANSDQSGNSKEPLNSDQTGNSDQTSNSDQNEPKTVTSPDTKQLPDRSQPYEHTNNIPRTDQCNTPGTEHPVFTQSERPSTRDRVSMNPDWKPSDHVFTMLAQRAITEEFARDQLDGFVLFHSGKSDRQGAFDSRFLKHVIHNWESAKTAARPIPQNWQPDPQTVYSLNSMSIPDVFIRERLVEFVAFWRESGKPSSGWNAKFYDSVTTSWNKKVRSAALQTPGGQAVSQIEAERKTDQLYDRLGDRSWAEG